MSLVNKTNVLSKYLKDLAIPVKSYVYFWQWFYLV